MAYGVKAGKMIWIQSIYSEYAKFQYFRQARGVAHNVFDLVCMIHYIYAVICVYMNIKMSNF